MDSNEPKQDAPTPLAPPAPQNANSGSEQTQIDEDLRDLSRQNVVLQRRMFWATVAIALTTGVYVLVTALQWQELRSANRRTDALIKLGNDNLQFAKQSASDARADTNRALKAAEDQAKAMTESIGPATAQSARSSERGIRATREATLADQRPWLGIAGAANGHIGNAADLTMPEMATIDLVFVNTGKTPALRVDICSTIQFIGDSNSTEQQLLNPRDAASTPLCPPLDSLRDTMTVIRPNTGATHEKARYVGVINPGQQVHVTVYGGGLLRGDAGLTAAEIRLVNGNKARLFVLSRAIYWDAATPPRRHVMRLCARWQPPSDKLFPCPFGNDSD